METVDVNGLIQTFMGLADGYKLATLLALLAALLISGIANALFKKEFKLSLIGKILVEKFLPFVVVFYVACLVGTFNEDLRVAVPIIWGILDAMIVGFILANLKEIGAGWLPDFLAGKETK